MSDQIRELVVTGEGKVAVQPDVVHIQFVVTATNAKSLKSAVDLQANKAKKLIDFLDDAGVSKKNINSTSYHYGPLTVWEDNKQVSKGYQVTQTINVQAPLERGPDLAEGAAVLAMVNAIYFTVKNHATICEEMVSKAIDDAKKKAIKRAVELGVVLGRVRYFEDGSGRNNTARPLGASIRRAEFASVGTPELPVGETEISAFVLVRYEIE